MDFASSISGIRKNLRLSQDKFGEMVNVSQRTVAAWESGDRLPSLQVLDDLALKLNVSTDSLLGRSVGPSAEVAQFANLASQLSDDDKDTVIDLMNVMIAKRKKGTDL